MSPVMTSPVLPLLLLLLTAPLGGAAAVGAEAACQGGSCLDVAGEEESTMMQVKAKQTHVSAKAAGEFNYKGFQLGDWPSVQVPGSENLCSGNGTGFQSPINIQVKGADYPQMKKGTGPTFYAKDGGCSEAFFVDKGTTWQVDLYDPSQGVGCNNLEMEWNGKVYVMIQFHFHTLSEDTLDFKPFPMQMHMVHVASDNSIAVVGVLIDTHGPAFKQNSFLNWVFKAGWESDRMVSAPGNANVNPYKQLLSKWGEFWHYPGSLTTPPCTDGLDFFIAKDPVTTAAANVEALMDHLKANGKGNSYGQNHRPIQPLNGRDITMGRWTEVCPDGPVPDCGDLDPDFCHWVEEYA